MVPIDGFDYLKGLQVFYYRMLQPGLDRTEKQGHEHRLLQLTE
jgi:hypothetical protein